MEMQQNQENRDYRFSQMYEALVGGFGGYACDPTSEGRCP